MSPRTPKPGPVRQFRPAAPRRPSGVYPCELPPSPVAPTFAGDYDGPPVPSTPPAAPQYQDLVADVADVTESLPPEVAEVAQATAPSPDATVRMPALTLDAPIQEEPTVRATPGAQTIQLPPGAVAAMLDDAALDAAGELPPAEVPVELDPVDPVDPGHEPTEAELDAAFGPKFARSLFDPMPFTAPGRPSARPAATPAPVGPKEKRFARPSDETGPQTTFGYEMKEAGEVALDSLDVEVDLDGDVEIDIEIDDAPISEPPIPMGLPRLEASLAWQSESQLWTDLEGHLGIFLATYAEIAIGEEVELHVHLPGEAPFVAFARVVWTRDPGRDAWPGLGLRVFVPHAEAARALTRYAAIRAPLFVD